MMTTARHHTENTTWYLELDQHAFTAHTAGAPQVVDVFIFLIQLPSAHCFFTGAVIAYKYNDLVFYHKKTQACAFHTPLV